MEMQLCLGVPGVTTHIDFKPWYLMLGSLCFLEDGWMAVFASFPGGMAYVEAFSWLCYSSNVVQPANVLLYNIFDNVQNWGNSWVYIKTTHDAVIWKTDLALEWHWFPHCVGVVTGAPNLATSTAYARVSSSLLITRSESFPSSKYFY